MNRITAKRLREIAESDPLVLSWAEVRQIAAALLAARNSLQRLRAIEEAARAYCDLTPDRADETPAPLLFSRLQAALAAKGEA